LPGRGAPARHCFDLLLFQGASGTLSQRADVGNSRPNTGISCETRFNNDTRAVPFAGARVSLGYTRFVCCIPLLCGAVLRNCCGLQGSAKQRALRNGRCRTLPTCPRAIRPTFRKGPASELRRWCSRHGFGPSPQSHDIRDSTTALCARGLERLARLQGLPVRLEAAQSQDGADGRDAHIHGTTALHARDFSRPADASAIRHEQRVRGCARVVLIEPCLLTPDSRCVASAQHRDQLRSALQ